MFNQFQAFNSFSSNNDTSKQQQEDLWSSSSSGSPPPQSDNEITCYSLATSRPKRRAGRRVFKETRHPVYRGVRRRNGDKWVCEMRDPNNNNTRVWLGTYPTPEMAARAHDVAALAFKGKSACLNFADSAWRLAAPDSLDPKVIRRAANEAAQMFQPLVIDQPEPSCATGSSRRDERLENGGAGEAYVDEEDVLEMPRLLADMAQGLLLSPPNFYEDNWDNGESESDHFSLWSY